MSDLGDTFAALHDQSQRKRAANRKASVAILRKADIPFLVKNNGAHLIVKGRLVDIDFWPGTGLWIERDTGKRGRGVQSLIKFIG